MPSLITDEIRAKAIIYHGKETCKFQTQRLLREVGLPNGLLPLEEAEECGHVEETGFVWLKQKKPSQHLFEEIGELVSYGTEVTAYAEPTKIRNLHGVKFKKLLLWISLLEINVPVMNAEKVTFKSGTGISKVFPAKAFEAKEDLSVVIMEKGVEKEKEKDQNIVVEAATTTAVNVKEV